VKSRSVKRNAKNARGLGKVGTGQSVCTKLLLVLGQLLAVKLMFQNGV